MCTQQIDLMARFDFIAKIAGQVQTYLYERRPMHESRKSVASRTDELELSC